jgi:hypothetical protein
MKKTILFVIIPSLAAVVFLLYLLSGYNTALETEKQTNMLLKDSIQELFTNYSKNQEVIIDSTDPDSLYYLGNLIRELKNELSYKAKKLESISLKDSIIENYETQLPALINELTIFKDELNAEKQRNQKLKNSIGKLEFEATKGVTVYYAGDIQEGNATGIGYGIYSTGSIYEGQWLNNKREGKGKHTWKDGSIYQGEFSNDERSGFGIYYFASGEKYEGEWSNNKRNGKGILYSKDGKEVFSGFWENDGPAKKTDNVDNAAISP